MGEVFAGRYELVDPIGRGGVGAVWRAWDHRRRRYVAAKVLQQSDAHSLLRFVREQALRIDHPHVLAPASWAADDDKVLFTMDLVGGGSLVHLVGDYGPLPPFFVCTLLDQLLSGLAAVHAEGVVHRDIKPANVLLEATGTARPRLRLSDFGIAMRLGEPRLTETNLVVGTPGYLAPEQMMGAEPDFPADLFAVGLVALYLLEGAKPDAKALIQYFAAHGTPGAPKGIPEPLWQVVASLLQPDPQARFRTATGARKALASAAELLPEPGPDDELIEIFDQIGPLPPGFGPDGPFKRAPGVEGGTGASRRVGGAGTTGTYTGSVPSGTGSVPSGTGSVSGDRSGSPGYGFFGAGVVPDDPRQGGGPPSGPDGSPSRPASAASAAGAGAEEPPTPSQPVSMSDTGSFHLPPPQATGSTPQTPPPPAYPAQPHRSPQSHQASPQQAGSFSPYETTHVLSPPAQPPMPQYPAQPPTPPTPMPMPMPAPQRGDASTASYTAESPQFPPSAHSVPQPAVRPEAQPGQPGARADAPSVPRAHRRSGRRAARPPRRPGPPAKVAIPILLLALACYAVGFWALARI